MTKEEAEKKWCPFVNFQFGPQNAQWQSNGFTNRGDFYSDQGTLCITDDCMAWDDGCLLMRERKAR